MQLLYTCPTRLIFRCLLIVEVTLIPRQPELEERSSFFESELFRLRGQEFAKLVTPSVCVSFLSPVGVEVQRCFKHKKYFSS